MVIATDSRPMCFIQICWPIWPTDPSSALCGTSQGNNLHVHHASRPVTYMTIRYDTVEINVSFKADGMASLI